MQHIFVVEKAKMAELWPFDNILSMLFTSPYHACCTCYKVRDYYMTFSILALVLARDSHIKPDSEAGGLIWVKG